MGVGRLGQLCWRSTACVRSGSQVVRLDLLLSTLRLCSLLFFRFNLAPLLNLPPRVHSLVMLFLLILNGESWRRASVLGRSAADGRLRSATWDHRPPALDAVGIVSTATDVTVRSAAARLQWMAITSGCK